MKSKLMLLTLVVLPLMFSCKKPSDEELKFTKLTVEEQKQKIEDNGINFLNNIQKIEDTDVFAVIQNFIILSSGSSTEEFIPAVNYLKNVITNKKHVNIQKTIFPKDNWGKWIWNFTNEEFVKTETYTTEKMIILFPSTETGTANNAEIAINVVNSDVLIPDTEDYFPTSVTSTLKVNSATLMNQSLTATYKNGYPTSFKESLTLDKFTFSSNASHTDEEISTGMSFKYDKTNLMGYEFNSEGKFDQTTLDSIEDAPNDIVANVKLKFSVMNIGVLGTVKDIPGFVNEMNSLGEKSTYTERAALLNKYFLMFAYFVDDNKKFADIEFFPDTRTETYTDYKYVYNSNTGQYEYVMVTETETNDIMRVRFIMNDGSKVSAEDYLQEGFEDLQAKLEEILGQYEE